MRRIGIVGAGQAGLVLAIGLRQLGYDVTLFAERPAAEVRAGRLISNQCLFHPALERERELGINFWDGEAPPTREIAFAAAGEGSEPSISWRVALDRPAQSVDQRVKVADWLAEFERLGGDLRIGRIGPAGLDECAREFELLVVAAGRGPQFDALFPCDDERSPYREPPVLSVHGPAHGIGFFGVPGGPMDVWDDVTDVEQHYETARKLLRAHYPWQAGLLDAAHPVAPTELLHGRIMPIVRHPVGTLPSGAKVLAMGDTAVTNDPVGGQGLQHGRPRGPGIPGGDRRARRPAVRRGVHARRLRPLLAARPARDALQQRPPGPAAGPRPATLDTAQRVPEVAHRFAHLFENPADYEGWLGDPEVAMWYLADVQSGVQTVPGAGTAPATK
jgi:hypothetical protein